MGPLPAALERFLCPPSSWHIELRGAHTAAECAALLNQRRVKNLAYDLIHHPGRTAASMRWTGPVATERFDIVEAGLAGDVHALGKISAAPAGSRIEIVFRLEKKQFAWDVMLLVLGWCFLSIAPRAGVFIAACVVFLFVLTQLARRSSTTVGASRLVGLVQHATNAEISRAEGGARIRE